MAMLVSGSVNKKTTKMLKPPPGSVGGGSTQLINLKKVHSTELKYILPFRFLNMKGPVSTACHPCAGHALHDSFQQLYM